MSAGLEVLGRLKKYPLAISCLVVFVVCGLALWFRSDRIAEFSAEEELLNSRIQVIERNANNSTELQRQLEEAQSTVATMRSRLFDRDERASNANFFYDMEEPFGIRITEINQRGEGYPFYTKGGLHEFKLNSTMVYNISLVGEFTNILSFIREFRQVEPFMRVADLQLERGNQSIGAGALQCQLTVVVMSEIE